jgi:hypothetical protein
LATPYPNHQRLLDLLKSLDLCTWPEQAKFIICFNNDPNVGLVSDEIKTTTLTIFRSPDETVGLGLDDIPVGHA